jgi:hypothetical protein
VEYGIHGSLVLYPLILGDDSALIALALAAGASTVSARLPDIHSSKTLSVRDMEAVLPPRMYMGLDAWSDVLIPWPARKIGRCFRWR